MHQGPLMRFLTISASRGNCRKPCLGNIPEPFNADFICGYALPHFMCQRYESVTVIRGHALFLCDLRVPQGLAAPHSSSYG